MDVFDAIKKRRSVRRFNQLKNISDKQIEKLLEAANWAPSAGNLQSYLIVVVKDAKVKRKLVKAAAMQIFISKAPLVFVYCADLERSASRYLRRGRDLYSIQDATIAAQNVFLAATEMGLGACWVGAFNEGKVAEALSLEERFRPVVIMPIGYPKKVPTTRSRRSLDEISRKI